MSFLLNQPIDEGRIQLDEHWRDLSPSEIAIVLDGSISEHFDCGPFKHITEGKNGDGQTLIIRVRKIAGHFEIEFPNAGECRYL